LTESPFINKLSVWNAFSGKKSLGCEVIKDPLIASDKILVWEVLAEKRTTRSLRNAANAENLENTGESN